MWRVTEEFAVYYHGTPSSATTMLGVWVNSSGHFIIREHQASNIRPDGLLIYCVAGSGIFKIGNEKEKKVSPGDIFFLFPDIPYNISSNRETGWEIWYIHVGGSYTRELAKVAGFTLPEPMIHIGIRQEVIDKFRCIYESMEAKAATYGLDASEAAISLFIELRRIVSNSSFADSDILSRLDYRMNSLDEVVRLSDYSKYHFIDLFKKATGMTPWRYVLHLKIDKAKELLANNKLTIKEVANEVGFEDPYYFSRIFRRISGMSPSDFRNSLSW